ncbi:MAG TPA: hypothetical protein VKD90_14335, partial [Gemmataceae bacterium]|nr:hypothetical protein [Gemmataceae bacterium]
MLTSPAPAAAPVVSPARRAWPSVARTLDVVSLTALLLTAFFLASVPARNGDLFGALAAGRDGTFGPGWLFDRVAYLTDRAAGPAAMVVLKAVALAAFVGLTVWAAARAGAPRRLAIYCGLPAALAAAPFAAVAPVALAPLFFSALLVMVLPDALRGAPPPPRTWLAVLVIAAWTVSAEYALFGPVTIAALALPAGGPGRRRWALVCGGAFLAAFARPDPLGALALPGLTAPTVPAVFRGEGWAALGSPLSRAFLRPHLGYGPAGAALLIAALAPLSVLAGRGARRPLGPILLWLISLAAALAHWAAIPMAAAAAAVLIGASAPAGARELTGRGSALAAGLLSVLWTLTLPVAAWAGWLQPPPYATRAWRAEPDPSLREVAETLAGWHRDGTWPAAARAAVLHPEAGDQLAWFCPAQHPTLTSDRLAARAAGPDHETIARALTDPRPEWGEVERDALRRLGATHLVLFHPDGGRFNRALTVLLNRPAEFPPLLWRGRVLVFGWRDPARAGGADAFPSVRLDLSPNSPDPDWHVPAPEAAPAVGPRPFTWRDVLSRPRPPRTADRDEASVALAIFEYQRQRAEAAAPSRFEAQQVAALVGAAAVGPAMTQVGVRAQLAFPGLGQDPQTGRPATPFVGVGLRYRQADLVARGAGPVGTLFRGVRAGRRAVAANPEDAAAWQALGECYLRLRRGTVERAWGDAFPALARVRAAQAA